MTQAQGGFGVDRDALMAAIKKLEDIRDRAEQLGQEALSMEPGELTAKDVSTLRARQMFQKRMTGGDGSLQSSADAIYTKLQEKIDAYRAVLGEYARADDNAAVDGQRLEGQA
ncbi:hypothetical protein DFQ14_1282 [Halopolyspora algeriensis]|uniref:PE family protein n=1 Tax=Halopolyspora algeriensis TaxID=1500506 RepID=A0A368VCV5_9ACTN|nr:hypothetical protein [Halopolyspora algeriensis]RCW37474.1 hypothetical protein DFQ14_1282 [Halopolyspora algeriensis]TQM42578.1 hypothetical protein FHU43_4213 [Halopolyspora algeriensis]